MNYGTGINLSVQIFEDNQKSVILMGNRFHPGALPRRSVLETNVNINNVYISNLISKIKHKSEEWIYIIQYISSDNREQNIEKINNYLLE